MSPFATAQREDLVTRLRPSILLAPNLSTIPSSTFVTSSTTSSFILPFIDRSGTLPNTSDAAAYPSNQFANSSDIATSNWLPSLRSISSMRGLLLAEMGDSMVELDVYAQPGGSGYRVGQRIEQGFLTPGGTTVPTVVGPAFEMGKEIWREDSQDTGTRKGTWRGRRGTARGKDKAADDINLTPHGVGLSASDTLLQISAPPHKSTSELRILLGNSAFRLKRNASVIPPTAFYRAVSTGALSTVENDDLPPMRSLSKRRNHAPVLRWISYSRAKHAFKAAYSKATSRFTSARMSTRSKILRYSFPKQRFAS
jgi:hypothetical protein